MMPTTPKLSSNPDARLSEIDRIYNPSLGAYLLWKVGKGYFDENGRGIPLPLLFLVLPLLMHSQTKAQIASTMKSSGLTLFAAKVGMHQEDLLAVHQRALALRELSFTSLSMACACQMLIVEASSALVYAIDQSNPPKPYTSMRHLGAYGEKLGAWFARLPAEQVASTLRIKF